MIHQNLAKNPINENMTTKLSEKLDILEIKMRQYIQYNGIVKQENAELHQQIRQLNTNLAAVNDKISLLQRQLEETKTKLGIEEEGKNKESKQLKKQLDQYIKYVDDCVDWLQDS